MTSKAQLAEQILLLLGRVSPESRFDHREIELNVGQVRDELLVAEYNALLSQDSREVPADWLTPFVASVEYDEARQREYVQLPYEPLHLPGDVGLLSLAPEHDEFNPFVAARPGALSLLAHHPGFALGGSVGYWREAGSAQAPGRAWFQRRIKATTPRVLGRLVPAAAGLPARAPFQLSAHLEAKIIDLVRQRYASKPVPDQVPDAREQV